jgi:hypothetical protein
MTRQPFNQPRKMNMRRLKPLIMATLASLILFGCKRAPFDSTTSRTPLDGKLTTAEFRKLMNRVAAGWNEGDAREAADCYTEDAIYTEPPEKQVYVGRNALYEFFGGDNKPEPRMKMAWHHLAFDEENQIGFGEYTFQMNNRYHGTVVVKIRDGKISNWREYQYQSNLDWTEFVGNNAF